MMQFSLHLVILFVSFSCKAEVNQTDFDTLNNKTIVTEIKNSSDVPDFFHHQINLTSTYPLFKTTKQLLNQDLNTTESTRTITASDKMPPLTTNTETDRLTSNLSGKTHTIKITPNITCTWKEDKYKTGIIICIIIIAVLVLICAVLIICCVALANKVSSLKTKLSQSKRQARSNGDFLSASSILWPSGTETWQKKVQAANQTMDEISLGDANSIDNEKHKLMAAPAIDKSKETTENKNTISATTISTVEI